MYDMDQLYRVEHWGYEMDQSYRVEHWRMKYYVLATTNLVDFSICWLWLVGVFGLDRFVHFLIKKRKEKRNYILLNYEHNPCIYPLNRHV